MRKKTMPLVETRRIQRCSAQIVGRNWAMLPNSAYCIDPLHSTGIAHTLFCIDRLMRCIQDKSGLQAYASKMRKEMGLIDKLVHGTYACMHDFESLANFVMLYFAGADFTERQRRAGKSTGFLNSDNQVFCDIIQHFLSTCTHRNVGSFGRCRRRLLHGILLAYVTQRSKICTITHYEPNDPFFVCPFAHQLLW